MAQTYGTIYENAWLFLTWVSAQWVYCGAKRSFKPKVLCIVESHFVNDKYAQNKEHTLK